MIQGYWRQALQGGFHTSFHVRGMPVPGAIQGKKPSMNDLELDVFTTGQVAKICNVAPRTVSKWFDSGRLRGYRIPGSKDRRIPKEQLLRFMKAHGIPLGTIENNEVRVLLVDPDQELTQLLKQILTTKYQYQVEVADNVLKAGARTSEFKPNVMVVDVTIPELNLAQLQSFLKSDNDLQATRLIAVSSHMTDTMGRRCLHFGFDSYIKKPFDAQAIIQAIQDAHSIIT